jgi:HNH endonuclease
MGVAYDEERDLPPYNGAKHFKEVRAFFEDRCCYCAAQFTSGATAVQDHLIPMNKADLGLHAWGNIVPACQACNAKKQRKDWRDFIIERAGPDAAERHARVKAFLDEYGYKPSFELREVAEELYEEVGSIAMTLINVKIKRVREAM